MVISYPWILEITRAYSPLKSTISTTAFNQCGSECGNLLRHQLCGSWCRNLEMSSGVSHPRDRPSWPAAVKPDKHTSLPSPRVYHDRVPQRSLWRFHGEWAMCVVFWDNCDIWYQKCGTWELKSDEKAHRNLHPQCPLALSTRELVRCKKETLIAARELQRWHVNKIPSPDPCGTREQSVVQKCHQEKTTHRGLNHPSKGVLGHAQSVSRMPDLMNSSSELHSGFVRVLNLMA